VSIIKRKEAAGILALEETEKKAGEIG